MNRRTTLSITALTLLCFAVAQPVCTAVAQEKQHISFKVSAENAKFTQQLNIDVKDVPNHLVRIFEVHSTFPNNAPVINGTKLVETWAAGIGDRVNGNGPATQYNVFVMENGDKFYARLDALVQSNAGMLTSTQIGSIMGGTGKFAAIQGIVRVVTNFNFNTGFNESQFDIDYSMGK
jgi:hypothetical protein